VAGGAPLQMPLSAIRRSPPLAYGLFAHPKGLPMSARSRFAIRVRSFLIDGCHTF
jgi:hypothetical protein